MTKILNGSELAAYIKNRHAEQVRQLISSEVTPKLAIVQVKDDPVIDTYIRLKKSYGADVGIEVDVHRVSQAKTLPLIKGLNADKNVHGIIVQLPLEDPSQTEEIVDSVKPSKDVDALGAGAIFQPATPMAILWLLSGYGIELKGKKILLLGRGRLVGQPLEKLLKSSGYDVKAVGKKESDLPKYTLDADIIITATGQPEILHANMIKKSAVVVDAGVASEEGKTVGDLADDVYQRQDLVITPKKGGVGPLTVCALFENVITAASKEVKR
ncbi:hypothetical protein A3A68_02085 [Candidatus Saccharibacteria bacterium RIFCSPLOWO2_01_FULL_48_13]|nr:MAG: hypothetical protein A3A68_02085 [Candidatus Saccharibacteria bacterium RIFCSPLOWO2_01_FULL_48_13]